MQNDIRYDPVAVVVSGAQMRAATRIWVFTLTHRIGDGHEHFNPNRNGRSPA